MWSRQNPELLASFCAKDGFLIVNSDPPSTDRSGVAAKAQSFMTAFPDMVVKTELMDQ